MKENLWRDIADKYEAIPVQVLLVVVAAPIGEEVCFRGMLFGGLRTRMSRFLASLISATIFGALHAFTGVSAVPPLIVFGCPDEPVVRSQPRSCGHCRRRSI